MRILQKQFEEKQESCK